MLAFTKPLKVNRWFEMALDCHKMYSEKRQKPFRPLGSLSQKWNVLLRLSMVSYALSPRFINLSMDLLTVSFHRMEFSEGRLRWNKTVHDKELFLMMCVIALGQTSLFSFVQKQNVKQIVPGERWQKVCWVKKHDWKILFQPLHRVLLWPASPCTLWTSAPAEVSWSKLRTAKQKLTIGLFMAT